MKVSVESCWRNNAIVVVGAAVVIIIRLVPKKMVTMAADRPLSVSRSSNRRTRSHLIRNLHRSSNSISSSRSMRSNRRTITKAMRGGGMFPVDVPYLFVVSIPYQ